MQTCRGIVDHVNGLGDGPLGGSEVDQGLASRWADRIHKWDGNLFLAANSDPGGLWQFVDCNTCLHFSETPDGCLHQAACICTLQRCWKQHILRNSVGCVSSAMLQQPR
jgi:hypothetical protein